MFVHTTYCKRVLTGYRSASTLGSEATIHPFHKVLMFGGRASCQVICPCIGIEQVPDQDY